MSKLVHFIDDLSDRADQTSAFMVILLFLIMGYEIFARFVFDLPTFWAYELGYMVTGLHYVLGSPM
jgi:TRAP-type mannitol/chloroaromatic compound transport system permease small subunit